MCLLNIPGLTWLSSHHILAPPFATLSERMKYNLQTVRRRMQVLANLAIVLIIPAEGGKEGGYYRGDRSTHPGLCGTEKPSASSNAARAAAQTPEHLGAKESASCHLLPGKDGGPHIPSPSFARESWPQPLSEALPPPKPAPSYLRLKWLRQARSTILARNRMAARGREGPQGRGRGGLTATKQLGGDSGHGSRSPHARRHRAGSGTGGPRFLPLPWRSGWRAWLENV